MIVDFYRFLAVKAYIDKYVPISKLQRTRLNAVTELFKSSGKRYINTEIYNEFLFDTLIKTSPYCVVHHIIEESGIDY